ncbi:MAG: DUF4114 domain-containing protein [Oscillatoriales cyanobacterium RM1_1_9]|nr:DUF4114 domain-containing protein [Oscillatoriales cyanobacterium SM2_3_0]NJO44816.1 DUF4114 domain-containing protein [Oscillatoriales cyanobacterium RM2_1_1]NJO71707.1 DUF4114 domain-containing protein [Oscillatoriales cyanobacterium RM1_1_9]
MKTKLIAALTALVAGSMAIAAPANAGDLKKYQAGEIAGFDKLLTQINDVGVIHKEAQALDPDWVKKHGVDLSKLFLVDDYEVKVHFLHEGAAYRNQFGYKATGASNQSGLIFKDIVCTDQPCLTSYLRKDIAPAEVLGKGDYKSLGTLKADTQLDFFLNRDAYGRKVDDVWYNDTARNKDGLQHAMAYAIDNYVVLAWEDIKGGGDKDYNDVVIALELGKKNVGAVKVPEPGVTTALFGLGIVGLARVRRQKKA